MEHDVKIVIGANYGDEGKGLMSRYFAKNFLDEGKKLTSALLQSCADNFASNPSKENANTIVDTEKKICSIFIFI